MADLPPYPGSGDDSGLKPDGGATGRPVRWLKMLGKVLLALLVLAPIVIHLILIGGPGRHLP
jgi:hypothetical protein